MRVMFYRDVAREYDLSLGAIRGLVMSKKLKALPPAKTGTRMTAFRASDVERLHRLGELPKPRRKRGRRVQAALLKPVVAEVIYPPPTRGVVQILHDLTNRVEALTEQVTSLQRALGA
jgi:hypothetical protein